MRCHPVWIISIAKKDSTVVELTIEVDDSKGRAKAKALTTAAEHLKCSKDALRILGMSRASGAAGKTVVHGTTTPSATVLALPAPSTGTASSWLASIKALFTEVAV